MSIKRLFDAVERRGDIGRRVAALVLPISNRPRVTSSCAGKLGLREPGEHTRGPDLASRDNVAHNRNLYTILETPPPATRRSEGRCQMRKSMAWTTSRPRDQGFVSPRRPRPDTQSSLNSEQFRSAQRTCQPTCGRLGVRQTDPQRLVSAYAGDAAKAGEDPRCST
jgi:hypothetical protein